MAEDLISPRSALDALPMGQQIQKLQQETESARDKLKAMSKALSAVVSTAQAHHDAVLNFADTLGSISNLDVFSKTRDLILDLSTKQLNCAKRKEEHLTKMIKDFVDVRIATALGMQAKVYEAIKEHEGASERVHSLKKGSPKLPDAQAQLSATQQQMDLLSFAYVNKLRQTVIDVSLNLLDKLVFYFGEETVLAMAINSQTSAVIPELTKQQAELKRQRQSNDEERAKEMKRHEEVPKHGVAPLQSMNHQIKQGYIFCRVTGRYRQRWVSAMNGKLLVYKNWKAHDAEMTFHLVLCNVKRIPADSSSHPFVFEVRSNRDDYMQFAATDEIEMTQWINVIQNSIAAQLGQNLPSPTSNPTHSDAYHLITSVRGNDKCADCRAPDPDWISFTQGIAICIECSGVHRSFGSHISKVRSLRLDALDPELVLLMTSIGNAKANAKVFEVLLPEAQRITPTCDRATREAFLKAKYVERRWVPVVEDWQANMVMLMRRKNPFKPTTLLAALVPVGADINWHRPGNQKTLLHKCVASHNLISALLLLKRECLVDPVDSNGMTPLHLAAQLNSAPMARLLMQHGASTQSLDQQRRTPRDVAIDHDAVDCIVLLDDELSADSHISMISSGSMPMFPHGGVSPLENDSLLAASGSYHNGSTSSVGSGGVGSGGSAGSGGGGGGGNASFLLPPQQLSTPSLFVANNGNSSGGSGSNNNSGNNSSGSSSATKKRINRPVASSVAISSANQGDLISTTSISTSSISSAGSGSPRTPERFKSLSLRKTSTLANHHSLTSESMVESDSFSRGATSGASRTSSSASTSTSSTATANNTATSGLNADNTDIPKRGSMVRSKSAKSVALPPPPIIEPPTSAPNRNVVPGDAAAVRSSASTSASVLIPAPIPPPIALNQIPPPAAAPLPPPIEPTTLVSLPPPPASPKTTVPSTELSTKEHHHHHSSSYSTPSKSKRN